MPSNPEPFDRTKRTGFAFRGGKFYNFHSFRKSWILVLSQWPDMRAWYKSSKGCRLRQIRPNLSLYHDDGSWMFSLEPKAAKSMTCSYTCHISKRMRAGHIEMTNPYSRSQGNPESIPNVNDRAFDMLRQAENSCGWYKNQSILNARYLSPIPPEVLSTVSAYPVRHWHLLNLMARCPGAMDLAGSTPALAMMLCSPWMFRRKRPTQPLRAARSLLRKKQADIAAWFGFPNSQSTVKILRKLTLGTCDPINLLLLRQLFATDEKTLRHISRINSTVIRVLSLQRREYRATPEFLEELAGFPGLALIHAMAPEQSILRDVVWMRRSLDVKDLMVVKSSLQLRQMHDQLVEEMGCLKCRITAPAPFPDPPLEPDGPHVELEALTSETKLLQEGQIQRNCVGAYATRVRHNSIYIYRMLFPERATLSVLRSPSGRWELQEIKAYANNEVQPETLAAACAWIAYAQTHKPAHEREEVAAPFFNSTS